MKHAIFSLSFALVAGLQPVTGAAPYSWVTDVGGPGAVFAAQNVSDAAGNTYATGEFGGTAQFGATSLTSSGGRDIYVAKFGPGGAVLWARRAGGSGYDFGSGIAVDAAGNVYVTGGFNATATFGSGLSVTATGGDDLFVAKYNSTGNTLWVQHAGGSSPVDDFTYGYAIAVDGSGNSYITGAFYGTATFGSVSIVATDYDALVAKFGPAGAPLWVGRAGGGSYEAGYGIAVDAAGNSSITGEFYSKSVAFGSFTVSNSNFDDIFTARYNAAGTAVWAKTGGGKGYDYGYGVAVDTAGNTYMTGGFEGPATFGAVTLNPANPAICAVKYNSAGAVVWAKNVLNPGDAAVSNIAVDSAGNSYLASGIDAPNRQLFVTKLDRDGATLWSKGAGGPNGSIYGRSVGVDSAGNCYPISEFAGTVNFDGIPYTSSSSQDVAVAKIADANGVLQFATTGYVAFENDGNVVLTVTRTGGTSNAVSVAFATANGTAVAGSDYTARAGTLNFTAGQSTATIAVPIAADAVNESPETFTATLSNSAGGALLGAAKVTKVTLYNGNRPAVGFSAPSLSVGEGAGPATPTVIRSGNTDVQVSVIYATTNGTAAAGSDYTAKSGLLTIPAGQTSASINVAVTDDTVAEPFETFVVKLSSPSTNCVLGAQIAETVEIGDNEAPVVQFDPAGYTISEAIGTVPLRVLRSGILDAAMSVSYVSGPGSASNNSDFVPVSGTLNFVAGQASATVNVTIVNDSAVEPNEAFKATLSAPSGATLGAKPVATIVIVSDD